MNFGERGNKRKYQWPRYNAGAKRFHGTRNTSGGEDVESRWDRDPRGNQDFRFRHPSDNSWNPRNKYNNRSNTVNNKDSSQFLYTEHPVSTDPAREKEEIVGPGSESERMEKVLATKKRIEEALASKLSNSNSKEINFHNSSINNSKDKNNENNLCVPGSDLSLTNSDFKEIGSVASAVTADEETNASNFIFNFTPSVTTCSSQQRSFDNTCVNTSVNLPSPVNKVQKVGGWSMSSVNEITNEGSNTDNSCPARAGGEMYLHQPREEILGNLPSTHKENSVNPSTSKQSSYTPNYKDDFSRVGQLYQSFLKSRLFGYTLKLKDKTPKQPGNNPFLDKSVLGNHTLNENLQKDQVLELQVPQPMKVKMEISDTDITENISEHVAAEEANEFCKEFSFLLKHPNFLIPPEDLEKLGLGHLSEMNKLIDNKKNSGGSESSVENLDFLRARAADALNNVPENRTSSNSNRGTPQFNSTDAVQGSSNIMGNVDSIIINNGGSCLNTDLPYHDAGFHTGSQEQSYHLPLSSQTMSPNILRQENTPSPSSLPNYQNISVEEVVEKVVKTILQPSNSQILNSNNEPAIETAVRAQKSFPENTNEHPPPGEGNGNANVFRSTPPILNQMQDISSKVLRLFLIDKQIEELTAEKMKIYNELLSLKEVSSTLFNSWAQDQIHQGNVMNVITNTTNIIPELSRVINHNLQGRNGPQASNTELYHDSSVQETIAELISLKKELVNSNLTTPQTVQSISCETSLIPSDGCFSTPKDASANNKPKLSVRKDLIDPNLCTSSLLNDSSFSVNPNEDIINNSTNMETDQIIQETDGIQMKHEKKKKKAKKKKEEQPEVINLIEDATDDEISSGTGSHSQTTDDLPSKGCNTDEEMDKNYASKNNFKMKYDVDNKTVTCVTVVKLKKKKAVICGCKEGFVIGYTLLEPAIKFICKIHNDTITAIHHIQKYLISGSLDSTICLLSLKDLTVIQTLSAAAPVQCMDANFGQLFVGTKAGLVCSYTIKEVMLNQKSHVSLHPNKPFMKLTDSSILAVKVAKEGARQILIVASRGEQITVRDSQSGLLLRTFDWCDTVFCLQLYGETPLVFCGTNTRSVKVVNYMDGVNPYDCTVGRSITQIIFEGSIMFAACIDGKIYVYDVEKKRLISTISVSKGLIHCLAINNNSILVSSSKDDLQIIPFPPQVASAMRNLKIKMSDNKNRKKKSKAEKKKTDN